MLALPAVPELHDLSVVVGSEPVAQCLFQRELGRLPNQCEQLVAQHAVPVGGAQLLEPVPGALGDVVSKLQPGDHPLLEVGSALGRHPTEPERSEDQSGLVGGLQFL